MLRRKKHPTVEVVRVQPGDVIVATVNGRCTDEQAQQIKDTVRGATGCPVIVLGADINLSVWRTLTDALIGMREVKK